MHHTHVITIHVAVLLICAGLFSSFKVVGQDTAPASLPANSAQTVNSPQPKDEYAALLARVQQGDMTVDFRAFRIAGALASGPHPSAMEVGARAAFNKLFASGDYAGALDSANQSLNRNYASPFGHFNAMVACEKLNKTEEAALHEKLLNALLASIGRSGDGKGAETAWFVVNSQEEYIFLRRIVGVVPKSQSLVMRSGHAYDRLEVVDPKTNDSQSVWFNTDLDMGLYTPANPSAGTVQVNSPSEKVAPAPVAPPQDVILAQASLVRLGKFHLVEQGGSALWGILYSVDGTYEVRPEEIILKVQSGSASISDSRPVDEVKQLRNLQLGVCYQTSENGA